MGNKTVKWKYGEKLLVQAVMDEELHEMIIGNIYVAGYEFSETVSDREGNQVQPLSTVLPSKAQLMQKPHCSLTMLHNITATLTVNRCRCTIAVAIIIEDALIRLQGLILQQIVSCFQALLFLTSLV